METLPPPQSPKATQSESGRCVEKQSKKYKKWSLGGFFRRRKKVSDTDSSSSSEDADHKRFLNRRRSLRKGKNREGKDFKERAVVNHRVRHNADIVRFEQSENTKTLECMPGGNSNETSKIHHKLSNYRDGSLEDAGHKSMNTRVKNQWEKSCKERLSFESSSDDTDEPPVQRVSAKAGLKDGPLSLRSRASRTERYKKRKSQNEESLRETHDRPSSRSSRSFEVSTKIKSNEKSSLNNQWTADVVYYESSDYDTKYTAKMKSASSSPAQSPKVRHKNVLCHTSSPTPSSASMPIRTRDEVAISNSNLNYLYYAQPVKQSKQKPSQRCTNTIPPRLPRSNSDVIFTESPLTKSIRSKNEPNQSKTTTSPSPKQGKMQIPPQPPPRDPQRKVMAYNDSSNKAVSYNNIDECKSNPKQFGLTGYHEFGSTDSAFRRVHYTPPLKHMDKFSSNESHLSNPDYSTCIQKNCTPSLTYQRPTANKPEYSELSDYDEVTGNTQLEAMLGNVPKQYHYFSDQPRCRKPIQIACKTIQLQNECYLSDSQMVTLNSNPGIQLSNQLTKSEEVLSARGRWTFKDHEITEKSFSGDSPNSKQSNLLNITTIDSLNAISPFTNENFSGGQSLEQNVCNVIDCSGLDSIHSEQRDALRTPPSSRFFDNDVYIPVESNLYNDMGKMEQLPAQCSESEICPVLNLNQLSNPNSQTNANQASNFEHYDQDQEKVNTKRNRKNRNSLEDALNELEAIYKSLKLEDDKYLENDSYDQTEYNTGSLHNSNWNDCVHSTGTQSDWSYKGTKNALQSAENVLSNKRLSFRRPETPNCVTDDMAYRRLTKKEKHSPQEREVISQAGSFLLVSPTLSPPPFFEVNAPLQDNKEPDITYDDVVYRNIQHANNTFKILDPQPPFGIPLWPVTPAPNTSYLCANSTEKYRPTFKPNKYPDLVADDLAFRNLRKDKNKEQLSKVKYNQDQVNKSSVESSLPNPQKIREKVFHKGFTAPFQKKLAYNNNNLEEDLSELQSVAMLTDSKEVSSFAPKVQYAKPVIIESAFDNKGRISTVDSNTTAGCSTNSFTRISPNPPTLTETIAKQPNYDMPEVQNPEFIDNFLLRSQPFNIIDFDNKSVSSLHQTSDSQVPDNTASKYESPVTVINDKYYETKNHEFFEKSHKFDGLEGWSSKKPIDGFLEHGNCEQSSDESSSLQAQSKSHDLDKKPALNNVKVNALCITEDEKLDNQQTTNSSSGVGKAQSLTDFCQILEDSLNLSFLEFTQELEKTQHSNNEHSTSDNVSREISNQSLKCDSSDLNKIHGAAKLKSEVEDRLSVPCCEGKLLPVADSTGLSCNEDSEFSKKSSNSFCHDPDEDRDNAASGSPFSAALSDEGIKEKCVLACDQHAFLVCMVWLNWLASLDVLTVLSVVLAVAAIILFIIF